jgi:hypothetical protein
MLPAIAGGVIGALAGGIPAFLIALMGSKEVLRRDREARQMAERTTAFRAHVRVAEMVNAVLSLQAQVEGMIPPQTADDPNAHLWQYVRPIAGLQDDNRIGIEPDEAAIFMAAQEADYVNDLLLLPRRHAAVTAALIEYGRKREDLAKLMPVESFVGEWGSAYMTKAESDALKPRMVELNSIIRQARTVMEENRETALSLARRFGPILKAYFKDPTFPGFLLDRVRGEAEAPASTAS